MLTILVMAILVMGLALVIGASVAWLARYGAPVKLDE
jgi:hypothetical protein